MIKPPTMPVKPDVARMKRHAYKLPELFFGLLAWPFTAAGFVVAMCGVPFLAIGNALGDISFWFNQRKHRVTK